MELREVRSLAVLGRLGSITKTAEQVHLSPAAVHKQIKNLERELGVRLYEKAGRRLHLTQAAVTILPYLQELLAQYDAISMALEEWKGLKRGFVRIGANPAISSYLVPTLLKRFRRKFPDVALSLEVDASGPLVERVVNRSIELALLLSSDLLEDGRVTFLATWEFEIVLVANMPTVPRRAHLASLQDFPFILLKPGNRLEGLIERYLAKNGFRPSVVMTVDNAHTLVSMVQAGLGVSMLPIWAVESDIQNSSLSLVRQREEPLMGKLMLVGARSGYISQPVRAFIDIARETRWKNLRLQGG
jgi:DNA-binding transcriptional LysR family regulator